MKTRSPPCVCGNRSVPFRGIAFDARSIPLRRNARDGVPYRPLAEDGQDARATLATFALWLLSPWRG